MIATDPASRAEYLRAIGAEPRWLAEHREESYRSGAPVFGEPGEVGRRRSNPARVRAVIAGPPASLIGQADRL